MENLSIVIKDSIEENIYNSIKILTPLLEDGKTQLILINNINNKFNIDYEYIVYEFEEEYEKFHEFCEASSFNNNLMIIEDGMALSEDVVKKIKELLSKHENINIKADLKKYLYKDNYYIEEGGIVYNDKSLKREKIDVKIDDFTYFSNFAINLKHNISRFIQNRRFEELYLWYKNYIVKDETTKLKFYFCIEKCKMNLDYNVIELIEGYFLTEKLDFKYCQYLNLMKMIKENNLSREHIKKIIQDSHFNEGDKYFIHIVLECFKTKKIVNEIFTILDENIAEVYINNLFDEYKDFHIYIYEFLNSIDINKELETYNNNNILIYINLIEVYYKNTTASFMNKEEKEKLIRLLIWYSNYGLYSLKNNLMLDKEKKNVLLKLEEVHEAINTKEMKKAANILLELAEVYNVITLPARYYAQKIIFENGIYSNVFSITMIVKNEENNLERCLKSLVPLLENNLAELIIVDTGSTDRTVDIAKRYTQRVYFHPWQGNFSEARNWSISLATGEYIFIIDADNEFDEAEIKKYIKFFSGRKYKEFNSFSFKLRNYEDEDNTKFSIISQNHIFKNDGTFYYYGTVHNQPKFKEPVKDLDIMVHHYGYIMGSREVREKKFNRTGYILKKELEKDPLNIYYRYQLIKSYSLYGDYEESLRQTKLIMKILNKVELNYNYIVYYNAAAVVYFSNKLYDEAIKICDDILSINGYFIDALYFKAISLYFKGDYRESIKCYKSYLSLLDNIHKNPLINDIKLEFYTIDSMELAEIDVMISYLKLHNYLECIKFILSKEKNKVIKFQFGIIKSFVNLNQFKELAIFYNKYIHFAPENDRLDFKYYVKNEIENMDDNKLEIFLNEFNKLNIKDEYFDLLTKSIKKREKNSLREIIRFLEEKDMIATNIMMIEKAIYDFIIILINNEDTELAFDEIIKMRKIIKSVLIQILNKKNIHGLNKKQIVSIVFKYIDHSFLVYKNGKQSLDLKEILFLENMNKSLQYIQKNDLINGVKAIKNAVLEDEEMANAMKLYIENLIDNNECKSGNEDMERYSSAVKSNISKLIEQGNHKDAIKLINEYEIIINNDLEIISMKAIVYILENKLVEAETTIKEGLKLDENNFDLLYNLAYIYEIQKKYYESIKFYNISKENTNNEQIIIEIDKAINKIKNQLNNI